MANISDLLLFGGAGVLGYRYIEGEWPWEAEWWPGGEGPEVPPGAEDFEVTSIEVSHGGETSTATATVENRGDKGGSITAGIVVSGSVLGEAEVSLGPGEAKTVSVDFKPESRPQTVCGVIGL